MNHDPIVAMIATYKEGPYWEGAIRSVLPYCSLIVLCEGCCVENEVSGSPTHISKYMGMPHVSVSEGRWNSEAEKRQSMLDRAKRMMDGQNFWMLTLDADEICIWPEFLIDWLHVLNPEIGEKIVPIKRTEAFWNTLFYRTAKGKLAPITDGVNAWSHYQTYIAPSRLIHSTHIERYEVGTFLIVTPEGKEWPLGHELCPQFPMPGEPHILHRPFYRRGERAELRLRVEDEDRYLREKGYRK